MPDMRVNELTMREVKIEDVNGWEVREREDGRFGVYGSEGLAAGPFGTRAAATQAAVHFPRRRNRLLPKDILPHFVLAHTGN